MVIDVVCVNANVVVNYWSLASPMAKNKYYISTPLRKKKCGNPQGLDTLKGSAVVAFSSPLKNDRLRLM